jgi:hypothetical protein
LGNSWVLWKQLVAELKEELKLDGEEWSSSGLKYGWSFRLQVKKRNIVYLGPRSGAFMASFVLGDKAIAVARKSNLPAYVLKMIAAAKRYGEGTPVRIEVSKPEDLVPGEDLGEDQGRELGKLSQPQLFRQCFPLAVDQSFRLCVHHDFVRPAAGEAFARPLAGGVDAHL